MTRFSVFRIAFSCVRIFFIYYLSNIYLIHMRSYQLEDSIYLLCLFLFHILNFRPLWLTYNLLYLLLIIQSYLHFVTRQNEFFIVGMRDATQFLLQRQFFVTKAEWEKFPNWVIRFIFVSNHKLKTRQVHFPANKVHTNHSEERFN